MKYEIPTNDVFSTLVLILGIQKDQEHIINLFEKGGLEGVTKSKIKAWKMTTGGFKKGLEQCQNLL